MRRAVFALVACLAIPIAFPVRGAAAPPLAPGDIVVAGYSYWGEPPGACNGFCAIDPALTAVTPISGPVSPTLVGAVVDLAIESPTSVVAVARVLVDPFEPAIGTVVHVDVATGDKSVLATGFSVGWEPSIAASGGRVFVSGTDGILEIDRILGIVSVIAPGEGYAGVDAEPGGASLVTYSTSDLEFVRIDLGSGSVTPTGETLFDLVSELDTQPDGDRFTFARTGFIADGLVLAWSPGGTAILAFGEELQAALGGIASDLEGNLLVAGDGHPDPDNPYRLIELQRWQPLGGTPGYAVLASLDTDFGISAIDVMLEAPACSDGIDNDGDGKIDWDGAGVAPADPGCRQNPLRNSERSSGCGLGVELALLVVALRRARR